MSPKEMTSRNSHRHKCSCGYIWRHSDAMAGSSQAHICANCSRNVWSRYHGAEKAHWRGCGRPLIGKFKAVAAKIQEIATPVSGYTRSCGTSFFSFFRSLNPYR